MTTQEINYLKAQELFFNGHPEESIEFFTKAEEEGCNPVDVYLSRGAAFLNIGIKNLLPFSLSRQRIGFEHFRSLYAPMQNSVAVRVPLIRY